MSMPNYLKVGDLNSDELFNWLIEEEDGKSLYEMVLKAEDTGFTSGQNMALCPVLLDFALSHRESQDAAIIEPTCLSAIRTGMSMIDVSAGMLHSKHDNVWRIIDLLQSSHPTNTTLVTAKMLGRIFEAQLPDRLDQHKDIPNILCYIIKSLMNEYVLSSSESAAMALCSVYALVAIGSTNSIEVIDNIRKMDIKWFKNRMHHKLCGLLKKWDKNRAEDPYFDFLNICINILEI